MEKYVKPFAVLLAIFIPLASYIGTSAVLFHRVNQLEQQDTTKLDARITTQWRLISEIRERQNRFLGEWEFFRIKINDNEQQIDALRALTSNPRRNQ